MATKSGIRLLDFGLAKAEPPQAAASGDGEMIEKTLTQEGAVAGSQVALEALFSGSSS